jgi:predicted phosphodiesterase
MRHALADALEILRLSRMCLLYETMNPLDCTEFLADDFGELSGDPCQTDQRDIPLVGSWSALRDRWLDDSVPKANDDPLQVAGKVLAPRLPFTKAHERLGLESEETRLEHRRPGEPEGDQVKVLVLADVHRSAESHKTISRGDQAASERFVDQVIDQVPHDVLLLAGDLTDTGHPEAFASVAAQIADDPSVTLAVPGNHDRQFRGAEQAGLLGIRPAESTEVAQDIAGVTGQEPGFPFVKRVQVGDQGLVVVGLDSCRRPAGSIVDNALGEVTSEQLLQAGDQLEAMRQPGDAVLMGLHHHLKGGPALLQLLDGDKVLDFIDQHAVDTVVSGHNHSPYVTHHGNSQLVSCGSAFGHAEGPYAKAVGGPSAYLLTFDADGLHTADLLTPDQGNGETRDDGRHGGSVLRFDQAATFSGQAA